MTALHAFNKQRMQDSPRVCRVYSKLTLMHVTVADASETLTKLHDIILPLSGCCLH